MVHSRRIAIAWATVLVVNILFYLSLISAEAGSRRLVAAHTAQSDRLNINRVVRRSEAVIVNVEKKVGTGDSKSVRFCTFSGVDAC
jgi:hypothetical protein